MTTYRWTGAHAYRDHRNDRVIEVGDTFGSDRIADANPHDVEVVENDGDDESADPPFDPGEYSVADLRDELAGGDYSAGDLDTLEAAEASGENRQTARDAIDAARE